MTYTTIYLIFAACLSGVGVSFLLDGQPGNIQEITHELLKLENKISMLENTLANIQQSCPSCQQSSRLPKPAFMASLSKSATGCTADAAVIFDQVTVNDGQAYDVRHGSFRAPITGTYSFSLSLSSSDVFRVNLVLNSVTNVIGYLYEDIPNGLRHESTSIVTHLTAGDDVWVACVPGTASNIDGGHGGLHSHFSGFLVD